MKNVAIIFGILIAAVIGFSTLSQIQAIPTPTTSKTVLLAILAKNKAHTLPDYLKCIENLDYDKKSIVIYIRTNNNSDNTKEILANWVEKNKTLYKHIEFDPTDFSNLSSQSETKPHDWTSARFKRLAQIRNKSLHKAKEYKTDYYFVVDCDNFITPNTLKTLIDKDKPIIAPMLRSIPENNDVYSNYFCKIDEDGYCLADPDYFKILTYQKKGTFEEPVVHCTYLINSNVIDKLDYTDGTENHEFVIFSRSARKNNVGQYICNEENFGTLLHFLDDKISLEEEVNRFNNIPKSKLLGPEDKSASKSNAELVFSNIYANATWGRNEEGLGFSGDGSTVQNAAYYMNFLQNFIKANGIRSVVDVGCGDWSFSQHMNWNGIRYFGYDAAAQVIERNQSKFATPTITFVQGDASRLDLPKADLLICKDVLQHLPNEEIALFLTQLHKFKHCLITNDVDLTLSSDNRQISMGDYRTIDLTKPPFNIPGTKIVTYPAGNFIKQILYIRNPV